MTLRTLKDTLIRKLTRKQKSRPTIPLTDLFSSGSPTFSTIIVHALLGVTTNFDSDCPNAWFAYDFALLYYVLSHNPSYCPTRSRWISATAIPYPSGKILFGEAGSKRLGFRVPSNFLTILPEHPYIPTTEKLGPTAQFYLDRLVEQVAELTDGQLLLIVLAGHGNLDDAFLMLNKDGARLTIPKTTLERAVREGRRRQQHQGAGYVMVFSNACFSGRFISPLWTTIAGATADEPTRALSQSPSGQCRGSELCYCVVGAELERQGITLDDIECDEETPPTLVLDADLKPITTQEHWRLAAAFRRFLFCSEHVNPFFCSSPPLPSPLTLSSTLEFTVHPAGTPEQLRAWEVIYPSSTLTGIQSPAVTEHFGRDQIETLRTIVLDVISQSTPSPKTRDFWLFRTCSRLSDKGLEFSQSSSFPWIVRNCYHQSRLARCVALGLGWTMVFGKSVMVLDNTCLGSTGDARRMSEAGMDPYILSHWPPMLPIPHVSAALWLAGLWVELGEPVVENWVDVVHGYLGV